MGAWGPGLRCNDRGLDGLDEVGGDKAIMRVVHKGGDLRALFDILKAPEWNGGELDPHEVLCVAECLLDAGLPADRLAKEIPEVARALADQLSESELRDWKHPKERRVVLEVFGKKLRGEPISKEDEQARRPCHGEHAAGRGDAELRQARQAHPQGQGGPRRAPEDAGRADTKGKDMTARELEPELLDDLPDQTPAEAAEEEQWLAKVSSRGWLSRLMRWMRRIVP